MQDKIITFIFKTNIRHSFFVFIPIFSANATLRNMATRPLKLRGKQPQQRTEARSGTTRYTTTSASNRQTRTESSAPSMCCLQNTQEGKASGFLPASFCPTGVHLCSKASDDSVGLGKAMRRILRRTRETGEERAEGRRK